MTTLRLSAVPRHSQERKRKTTHMLPVTPRRYHRFNFRLTAKLFLLLGLLLAILLARPGQARFAPTNNKTETTALAEALTPDGKLKPGIQGSFNTAGYRMMLGPGGAPTFVQGGVSTECARWSDQFPLHNGTDGLVFALAVSGNHVYVGGAFNIVGDNQGTNVARWDSLNQVWEPLLGQSGEGVNGPVYALAVSGSDVYVGGSFTQTFGLPGTNNARNVAKWNSNTFTWSALTGPGGGNGVIVGATPLTVRSLAVLGSNKVIVGGDFPAVNFGGVPVPVNNLAIWDNGTWSPLTGQLGGNGVGLGGGGNWVNALAVSGNEVFVGGQFNFVNGLGGMPINASNVAKWNSMTNTWSVLNGPGNGEGVSGPVNALALIGSDVYVGGDFNQANVNGTVVNANNVAKWNNGAWSVLGGAGGGNGVNDTVNALTVNGGDVYVGGLLGQANVGGTVVNANFVAKWNSGSGWSALTGAGGGNGVDDEVYALAPVGGEIFVGGRFLQANLGGTVIAAYSLAKFGSGAWSAINQLDGANGVLGFVLAIAVSGNDVYVGGMFGAVGNVLANNVAKWNGLTNTWSRLPGANGGNGVDGEVRAIALNGNYVYVGGRFSAASLPAPGVVTASNVARWNSATNTWSALTGQMGGEGVPFIGTVAVNALAVSGNFVYVGGQFTAVNNGAPVPASGVARWDSGANTWSALMGPGGGEGVQGIVHALAASGNDVYVGGSFTLANNNGAFVPANHVARWNSSNTWSNLPGAGGGNGVSGGSSPRVNALALSGSFVYVGGNFTTANIGGTPSVPANRVARWNISNNTWSALPGAGGGNGVNNQVFALAVSGNDVYVGGTFNTANVGGTLVQAPRVAKWNGATNTWSNLSDVGGAPGILLGLQVSALGVVGDSLYAGGIFQVAGEHPSNGFAKFCPNSPPFITSTAVTVRLGAPAANVDIAFVSDLEDPLSALTVRVNGGASATANGVTISNISIKPTGYVSANIVAAPGARTTTFSLTVSDAGFTTPATLTVTVIGFNVVLTDPAACLGPGGVVGITAQVTNTNPTTQNFSFTATLPAQLQALAGSCTVNTGTCTVVSATTVTWTGALATNQTLTIQYQAQVTDSTPPNTTLCVNSAAGIVGQVAATVEACTIVDCPVLGPGSNLPVTSSVSDQKPGSVLVYNLYSSSIAAPNAQNTRLSVTNTHPALSVGVHLFFVDGATCSIADAFVCLTPNQKAVFLASDIDPGTTGYLVAVASDPQTGCPLNFNYLIGSAHVKLASGHEGSLNAEAFAALANQQVTCNANSSTAVLNFDGVSYNQAPRTLALDDLPSRADGNDTLLVLNRFGGSLVTGAATLTGLFGILYDDVENPLSFNFNPGTCQFRSSFSNNFPRVAPRFDQFIPAGRSGWAKFYSTGEQALLGAAFNFNPSAGTAANAFNQGRNLHKLTLTSAVQLTIPIFPPNC
jgi:trimeric autotransporter adhesin